MATNLQTKSRDPIAKALGALTWMIQDASDDVGVRELAAAVGVSPSSAHRLLSALVEVGFVRKKSETARYALGLEFLRLCHIATARLPIRQAAMPHVNQLADACSETVLLGVYDPAQHQVMFAARVDAPHPLRYVIDLNVWLPIHAGASGLAIMAMLAESEVDAIIAESGMAAITDATLTDPAQLKEQLAQVRARGYALTHGQRIQGAVGISAPFFSAQGDVLGDIVVTVPEQRFEAAREASIAEMVMVCAENTSAEFGGSRPGAGH